MAVVSKLMLVLGAVAGMAQASHSAPTALRGLSSDQITCGGLTMTSQEWAEYWPEEMTPLDWIIVATLEHRGSCDDWSRYTAYYYQDSELVTVRLSDSLCQQNDPPLINRCAVTNGGTGMKQAGYYSSVNLKDFYINTPDLTYSSGVTTTGVAVGKPLVVQVANFRDGEAQATASFSNTISSTTSSTMTETNSMGESLAIKVGGPESPVSSTVTTTMTMSTTSSETQTTETTIASGSDQTVIMQGVTCTEVTQTATTARVDYTYTGTIHTNGFALLDSKHKGGEYLKMDYNIRNGPIQGDLDSYDNDTVLVSYTSQDYMVVLDSNGQPQKCDWTTTVPTTSVILSN